MSRFDFERPPPLTEVVAKKGDEYEVTFQVPAPVGKFWADTSLELLEIVNKFQSEAASEIENGAKISDAESTVRAFRVLTQDTKFWKKLLPACLGLKGTKDEKEGIKYLEGALTNGELAELFIEAASEIVTYSFKSSEVEEALEKSEGGEAAEGGEPDQSSDGTTQPQ